MKHGPEYEPDPEYDPTPYDPVAQAHLRKIIKKVLHGPPDKGNAPPGDGASNSKEKTGQPEPTASSPASQRGIPQGIYDISDATMFEVTVEAIAILFEVTDACEAAGVHFYDEIVGETEIPAAVAFVKGAICGLLAAKARSKPRKN